MIIDAHAHIGFNETLNAAAKEVSVSMRKAGIGKALVFASAMSDCLTERLLREIAPYPDRMYGIGSVSPLLKNQPSLKQVEAWLKGGRIRGLKFYTGYEHFYPADRLIR